MASPSFSSVARPRPKSSVYVAYVLCPILCALSVYGFWRWLRVPVDSHAWEFVDIFYNMSFAVLPMVLLMFLAVVAAQRLEYNRLSASYQVRLDLLQKRLNGQEDFLHSVTDHNPEAITIFDKQNNYWFANLSAAKKLGHDVNDIIGASLIKILDFENARKLEMRLEQVRSTGRSLEMLDQVAGEGGAVRFIQSHYELIAAFGDFTGGVMVREEDVTNLIVERERRETMLRQVIGTLVAVVDRRDPYASGHSARVGQLAHVIAEEMVLDSRDIETAEISGALMNFGKVLVPREILTKTTALTPEELQLVRDSILTSADILSIIDFSGPVVPTLKQVLERYDGSGAPQGLKGDQILVTARIVAVANTYVALVSPRAHRPSMGYNDAVQHMLKDADKLYDRRVVTALINYIENRANKLDWLGGVKQG